MNTEKTFIYTPKLEQAMYFAERVHRNQNRKGKEIPYLLHLQTVAVILSRAGASEDTICAGLLHDTIEDTPEEGGVTYEDLVDQFGESVADPVLEVTERDKSLPWKERKRRARERIPEMSREGMLVKAADLLHNLSSLNRDYRNEGDALFERFNAPRDMQYERYRKTIEILRKTWPENPILPELKRTLAEARNLFGDPVEPH